VVENDQDFAGALRFSAVNSLMLKSALLGGIGFLSFCSCLTAQQTSSMERSTDETSMLRQLRHPSALDAPADLNLSRPEFFSPMHGSVLTEDVTMLTLWDEPRLPASSELVSMGMPPLDFQEAILSAAEEELAGARVDGKDSPSEMVTSSLSPLYCTGELGVFYGRSSGKFDREIMQTYFLGTVGNDNFQITVGTAYEESNGRLPRFHSFTGQK
jgi:hypothetical protein